MSDQYEISANITADDSGFQAAFDRMESSLGGWGVDLGKMYEEGASVFKKFGVDIDQFASKLGTTGPMLATSVGVAIVAIQGLSKVIQETTKEFAEDETAQLKFNAAIKANSQLTEGANERLSEFAESFATLTGEANSAAQSQVAMLSATGRTEEQITKTMEAALGLANATGTDLNTALTQVNQTFSGTTGRLARTTPELASLTKEELENGKAVDILLEKYGSFTTALKDSSEVSMSNFKNSIGELKSLMGGWFESGLKPVRDGLTEIVNFLVKNKDAVTGVLTGLAAAVGALALAIAPLPTAIGLVVAGATALVGILGKSKQSYDDGKTAIDQYRSAMDKLTTSQLEAEKAELESLKARATGGAGTQSVIDRLNEVNKLLAERNKLSSSDDAKKREEERAKAEQEYQRAVEGTNANLKSGLSTQKEALSQNISSTEKYATTLAELGLSSTKAYSGAIKSLSEYKTELTKLENTEENQKVRQAEVAQAAKDGAEEIAQAAKLRGEETEAAVKKATDGSAANIAKSLSDITNTFSYSVSEWLKPFSKIEETLKDMFGKDLFKTIQSFTSNASKLLSGLFSYLQSNIDATLESANTAIEERLKNTLDALDEERAAKEEAAGVSQDEDRDAIVQKIADINLELKTETDATKAAALQKQLSTAETELKKHDIEAEYQAKKAAAEKKAEAEKAQAEYEAAMDSYNLKIAQAIASAALAIVNVWATLGVNPILAAAESAVVAGVTAFQIATIENSKPTPPNAAATGTDYSVAGYYTVGELGPERVYLPQGSRVSNAVETARGGNTSNNNMVININSPTALDAGEANRLFKRTQRELVFSGAYA